MNILLSRRCTRFVVLLLGAALHLAGPAQGQEEDGAHIHFSFDQADLRLVIKLVGEATGKRFVVDESVKGAVTVVTPPRVPVDQVIPFLASILESRGYTLLDRGGLYHVVPLPGSDQPSAPVFMDGDEINIQGLITRIIRLEHIPAQDVRKSIEPLVRGGKAGAVTAFGPTNHLILTDTVDSIARIERLLRELDRPGSGHGIEVVALTHASAEDLARQLAAAVSGAESSGQRMTRHMQQITEGGAALPGTTAVVPAPHANSLILVGSPMQITEMKRLIALLDVETTSGYGRLNVIFLKYLSAEEAGKSLNALLTRSAEKETRPVVSVEPSIPNNALLIDASPSDYELVKELVERLDQPPQQVMVEILIAELTLGKALDIGVDWSTIDAPREGSTTVIGRSRPGQQDTLQNILAGMFPEGMTLGVARGTFVDAEGRVVPRIPFLIRAMAEDRDIKILSNIPLWAHNNLEASVSVVENIPILRSTIEGGAGTARDVIQNIERLDVGIQLKVTPYVNPDQDVRLKLNPIIEAIVDDGPDDTEFAPTIARREVSTTVTIPDKATVVISGLIREDRIKTVSKVPLLGDIPFLGHLFRRTGDRTQRTNLLIFVTPHIVTDLDQAASLRDSMEERTGIDRAPAMLPTDRE